MCTLAAIKGWATGRKHRTVSGATPEMGPGCVKTSTRGERAELFSLFSSFDGACQSGSFLIQRHRDKRSTRKFDGGVFTQPGSKTDFSGTAARGAKQPIVGRCFQLCATIVNAAEGPAERVLRVSEMKIEALVD